MDKIEKEFFEAFGTEPKEPCKYGYGCGHAKPCCPRKKCLPPITADIILGLMQIILEYIDKNNCETLHVNNGQFYFDFYSASGENIKECVLLLCIQIKNKIQTEVRNLFNGQ